MHSEDAYRICHSCEHARGGSVCSLTGAPVRFSRGQSCPDGRWVIDGQSIVGKAKSFVKAVTSGRATDEAIAERSAQCNACDKLVRVDDKRYCGACGCGRTRFAELATKLAFANVTCPLGKPGFTE